MHAAKAGDRVELVPVGRLGNPIQVVAQEGVIAGVSRHVAVRENDCGVADAVFGVNRVFEVVQEEGVDGSVVSVEVEVGVYGRFPGEDGA